MLVLHFKTTTNIHLEKFSGANGDENGDSNAEVDAFLGVDVNPGASISGIFSATVVCVCLTVSDTDNGSVSSVLLIDMLSN